MGLSLIERLREKPKHVRTQVSFLTALSVTGVIALLWGVTLPMRLDTSGETVARDDSRSIGSFFSDTKSQLGQVIGAGVVDGSVSETGTYQVGTPEDAPRPSYQRTIPEGSAATPVRREVQIATTSSRY